MLETLKNHAIALKSKATFWSLRYYEETAEILAVRDGIVQPPRFVTDRGVMITAVVDGGCGYAATTNLSQHGLQQAMEQAEAWAQVTSTIGLIDFRSVQMESPHGEIATTTVESRPQREWIDLLKQETAAAHHDERIVDALATLELRQVEQIYLTSTGGEVQQRFRYLFPNLMVTASQGSDSQTRSLGGQYNGICRQGGMELLDKSGLHGSGHRIAEEALELLTAPRCPTGVMSLLLMPDQMMLQIHESIGHPLELDRILGDERNYAGTSFVTPEMFGTYQYGSELLDVTYDPTLPSEVASFVFDDDGTRAEKVFLIQKGILERPLGGSLSQQRAKRAGAATSRASSWNRPPIDRMSNLNVEPGETPLEQMIASVDQGILMTTNSSWSIDDSRNKFQFGCEWGRLIEKGRLGSVVRNPNYRGISASFWRKLTAVGDPSTFEIHGTPFCGKGEPSQIVRVGHASPACLFREVEVFGGET